MIMDNNNSNNNNSNKPNNKVNMPKFNLNWMYMIIALMLLGLWWGSDSKGAGSKAVTYSEFQDYVKKGYVSKVLGYEDKSIEAFLKPTAVGLFLELTLPRWDATLSLQVEPRLPINWKSFCRQKRKPVILTVHPTIRPNRIFSPQF